MAHLEYNDPDKEVGMSDRLSKLFEMSGTWAAIGLLVSVIIILGGLYQPLRAFALPEILWLPIILIGITGLRWWQENVNIGRSGAAKVPEAALVLVLVFWCGLTFCLYGMTRALWQPQHGLTATIFVGILWGLACASVGGVVGFIFGVTRVTFSGTQTRSNGGDSTSTTTTVTAAPQTVFENIAQWLGTALAGGVLFQAGNLGKTLESLGAAFAGMACLYAKNSSCSEEWLKTLGGASAVLFTILGFLAVYLLTKLFLDPALRMVEAQGGPELERRVHLSAVEFEALKAAPITVGDAQEKFSEIAQTAAKRIVAEPFGELHDWRDLALYAKAQLSLGKPAEAVKAYRKALDIVPDDAELLLGFAAALSSMEQGGKSGKPAPGVIGLILTYLEQARESLKACAKPDVRKNIYKSLTYGYLYTAPPDGFRKALEAARHYFEQKNATRSVGVLTNIVCAYGQAHRYLRDYEKRKLKPEELKVEPDQDLFADDANREIQMLWLENEVVRLVTEIVNRRPESKAFLRRLAGIDSPLSGEEDDDDLKTLKTKIAAQLRDQSSEDQPPGDQPPGDQPPGDQPPGDQPPRNRPPRNRK